MTLKHAVDWQEPVQVLAPADRTATATSGEIDLSAYHGKVALTLDSAAGTGTNPTLDVKVQDKSGTAGAYADMTGKVFTQVTNAAASIQRLLIDTRDVVGAKIKVVATIGGTTPHFVCGVSLQAVEEYPAAL